MWTSPDWPTGQHELDARAPAFFARLRLTRADGGREVVVRDYDPSLGPPDPPPPPGTPGLRSEDGYRLIELRHRVPEPGRVGFPLATAWDELPPGVYRGVVELDYHDSYGAPNRGTWSGVVRSAPFTFRIEPEPTRYQQLFVPDGDSDSTVELRLPVRNGFAIGLRSEHGASVRQPGPEFAELVRRQLVRGSGRWEVFETASVATRHWSAARDPYHRALWSTTLE